MNENTEITLTVTNLAKYVSVTTAILLKNQGFSVQPNYFKLSHLVIVADIIEKDSIKGYVQAFDKQLNF